MEKEVPRDMSFYLYGGGTLKSIEELASALKTMDDEVFLHHVHSGKNDFANWIRDVFSDRKLANKLYILETIQDMAKEIDNHLAGTLPEVDEKAKKEIESAIALVEANELEVKTEEGVEEPPIYEDENKSEIGQKPKVIKTSKESNTEGQTPVLQEEHVESSVEKSSSKAEVFAKDKYDKGVSHLVVRDIRSGVLYILIFALLIYIICMLRGV